MASALERLQAEDRGAARVPEAESWINDHAKSDDIKELIVAFVAGKKTKSIFMGWDRFADMLKREYDFPFKGNALQKYATRSQ